MKHVLDTQGPKSVSAVALMKDGKLAGKIVANYSNNPNGSVCTAGVWIWDLPEPSGYYGQGRAAGYGYCKFSSAVNQACRALGLDADFHAAGHSAVQSFFEEFGYTYVSIL